jgi:hypothetical protein
MRVETSPLDASVPVSGRGWSGFLIGAGGLHVDHRLTALVHHRPAEDGGLLAVVDPAGRVSFRDNGRRGGGGPWSIGGPLGENEVPVIAEGPAPALTPTGPIALTLDAQLDGDGYRLVLTARDPATGGLLSAANLDGVDPARVDGALALVSHLGPGTGGFRFRRWEIAGSKVSTHEDRAFGPILAVQYTLSGGRLNLTAQLGPLGADDTRSGTLQRAEPDGTWRNVATVGLVDDSYTMHFTVPRWDASVEHRYRITYDLAGGDGQTRSTSYEGVIRAEPTGTTPFVIGSLNCHKIYTGDLKWNHGGVWFPHAELIDAVRDHDPDLLFFAGDQIYEGDLDPAQRTPEDTAILDYLNKYYRWCWSFGELTRSTPTVMIPDDHDVYHGNLWGAGGKRARAADGMTVQDAGGYRMSPRFVNAVHRTQTGHLPEPHDPDPIGEGYSTYYTRLEYGGVSFAILADRQFKSSPTVMVPAGDVVNGWFRNESFDPATQSDVEGAVLLGEAQLAMLDEWAVDWSNDTWMKVVLSQTPFANIATLPAPATSDAVVPTLKRLALDAYPEDDVIAADADSNGWPQSGRNRALRAMRRGFAIHLAGDQHLGSVVQYGIDRWRDAAYAFCAPAIANTWPRRWYPPEPGGHQRRDAPRYTGDYLDGFGNRMTVHAIANPVLSGREPAALYDRAPGYGIVRLDPTERTITFEAWPRWVDPMLPGAEPYPDWPKTIHQVNNGPRSGQALPLIWAPGSTSLVVTVTDERTGVVEYRWRVPGERYIPTVSGPGPYTLRVENETGEHFRSYAGLTPRTGSAKAFKITWPKATGETEE